MKKKFKPFRCGKPFIPWELPDLQSLIWFRRVQNDDSYRVIEDARTKMVEVWRVKPYEDDCPFEVIDHGDCLEIKVLK